MGADTTGPRADLLVANGRRRRGTRCEPAPESHSSPWVSHKGAGSLSPLPTLVHRLLMGSQVMETAPKSLGRNHLVGYRLSLALHHQAAAQSGGDP